MVGASGAGKTTLTKLLLRFYDPDQGRITLDGLDIRELSLSDLRRNVAAVLQETLVFDGTIADNILWGRPGRHRRRHRARRAAPPTPTASSRTCPTATTPASASAAGCCPAASGSGWPSPAR